MPKITIPYKPRTIWRDKIHPALEQYRWAVIVAHRRFGKTVGSVNHLIRRATQNKLLSPQYAYIAPFQKQARMIAWNYLKYYTNVIPGTKANETNLYIEFPTMHKNAPGARIYIVGADNPDVLRGTYWDGVIIDEYAQIKPELWGEVIRPALADRTGWAVFIGTPKGQNQFYEIYQRACASNEWYVCMYRADESGVIPDDELESMKRDMTPTEVRQELYCDFTASAFNVLITIDVATEAAKRIYTEADVMTAEKVLGVDVARFGDDRSVIFRRRGLQAFNPKIYDNIDNMQLAACVAAEIQDFDPDAVFIDSGRGEGVIDRLRQLGFKDVMEVPFGGAALKKERYANKRTEMWDSVREWLEKRGGAIPNIPELKTDLVTPEYSFDTANRMKLEPKEKIKERLGKSTDLGDALALTFAYPVVPKTLRQAKADKNGMYFANNGERYNPLARRR
ncbi:MAG: hypothetical protein H6Q73_190 [Firmicutes bacterium]|nr:hypothetical protein [Bacillota bacterium]